MRERKSVPSWTIGAVALAIVTVVVFSSAWASGLGWARSSNAGPTSEAPLQVASSLKTPCVTGYSPQFPVYDPVDHDIYVPNYNSANISVFTEACKSVGIITLAAHADPVAGVFDPQNDYLYVTDCGLNKVYLIQGLTVESSITDPSLSCPWIPTYDPENTYVIVPNSGSNTITVLNGNIVEKALEVGTGPTSVDYDPVDAFEPSQYTGIVVVANHQSDNLTVLLASNLTHLWDDTVGGAPYQVIYDPASLSDVYTLPGSGQVGFLQDFTTVNVGKNPMGIVFDQATLSDFVVCSGSHNVWEITDLGAVTHFELPSSVVPIGIAYSDANNNLYITAGGTGFSGPSYGYLYPSSK